MFCRELFLSPRASSTFWMQSEKRQWEKYSLGKLWEENLPALQRGADSTLRSGGNRKEESFPRMQRRLQCLFQPTDSLPSTRVLEKGQSSCKKHRLGLISFRLLSSSISDESDVMTSHVILSHCICFCSKK